MTTKLFHALLPQAMFYYLLPTMLFILYLHTSAVVAAPARVVHSADTGS